MQTRPPVTPEFLHFLLVLHPSRSFDPKSMQVRAVEPIPKTNEMPKADKTSTTTHFRCMPVDKTTIRTSISLKPDFLNDPVTFICQHGLEVRATKPSRGRSKSGPTMNLTLDVLRYKGVKVKVRWITGRRWADVTIRFNPCVCLYGHNGAMVTLDEFIYALSLAVTHLRPILNDVDDWPDLVPGLRPDGVAYWASLELLHQCADKNHALLNSFRNASYPGMNNPPRHWPTSVTFGASRSKLQLAVYLKGHEMVAKDKLPEKALADYGNILRLEMRLKEGKLLTYLGHEGNVQQIGGRDRLVWFHPQGLYGAIRQGFGVFKDVYCPAGEFAQPTLGRGTQNAALGRLLAQAARASKSPKTFPELLADLRHYFGASSTTIKKIRDAGQVELARHSTTTEQDLFSDAAFDAPCRISSPEIEKKVRHDAPDETVFQRISQVYRPTNQPFRCPVAPPTYLRP